MKYFFSSLFGLIVGVLASLILVYLSTYVAPLPSGINILSIDSIIDNLDDIPDTNLVLVIVSYALASLLAGFSSVKIETEHPWIPLSIIGALLTVAGFINFVFVPLKLWVLLVGSFTFFPMTRLGGMLGSEKLL